MFCTWINASFVLNITSLINFHAHTVISCCTLSTAYLHIDPAQFSNAEGQAAQTTPYKDHLRLFYHTAWPPTYSTHPSPIPQTHTLTQSSINTPYSFVLWPLSQTALILCETCSFVASEINSSLSISLFHSTQVWFATRSWFFN